MAEYKPKPKSKKKDPQKKQDVKKEIPRYSPKKQKCKVLLVKAGSVIVVSPEGNNISVPMSVGKLDGLKPGDEIEM